ncbi:hypothetical protein [Neobacillus sp. PS2-9]|uniref:hypothetical protein n=1 Tax=Neobacillus sp. PS2-9 TaxID=3070676 RepID=UPI0027E049F0|nr:hypothetical protein [Neobacillus sp. PS2-9]WML58327.1 hypothetical protein RCG25_00495 [Neobacillus sp. PS2-9]
MKKILAFTSLVFIFLLAVLPTSVSHAAAATKAELSGVSLFTDSGEVKAEKKGNNFVFNFVGKSGKSKVQKIEFYSTTAAKTVSLLSDSDDDSDLQFVDGKAVLDVTKYKGWLNRGNEDDGLYDGGNYLFTVQDLKDVASDDLPIQGFLNDELGNQTTFNVVFNTTEWVKKNGQWVFVGTNSDSPTAYATGWAEDNGTWYYLGTNGVMKTGWVMTGGKWYFLNPSGAMAESSWVKSGGKWYYLNQTGAMATGWAQDKGTWYFLDSKGVMKTGWVKSGGKWYFLKASGAMATGWVKLSNKWYYLTGSGAMATGWVNVSNKWYYLYSDGHMAANTKIGSYKIGRDGAWIH